MAEHSTLATQPAGHAPETPEAFLADRQRFWSGFTHFTLASLIFVVALLVLMALFLL